MSGSDPEQQLEEIITCCDKIVKYSGSQPALRAKTLKDLQDILRVLMKSGAVKKGPVASAPSSAGRASATSATRKPSPSITPSSSAQRASSAGKKPPNPAPKKKDIEPEPVEDEEPPPYIPRMPAHSGHLESSSSPRQSHNHHEENIRGLIQDGQRDDRDRPMHRDYRESERSRSQGRGDYDNRDSDRSRNHGRGDYDPRGREPDYDRGRALGSYDARDRDYDYDRDRGRGSDYHDGRSRRDNDPPSPRDGRRRDSHGPGPSQSANDVGSANGRQFMSALSGMHGAPSDQDRRIEQQKRDAIKREWEDQIREKKEREAREKERIRRLEEKEEREMATYNPFGRGGAGAPMRDDSGNIIASRKAAPGQPADRLGDSSRDDRRTSQHDRDYDRDSQDRRRR